MKTPFKAYVQEVEDAPTNEAKNQLKGRELAKIRNRIKISDDQGSRPRLVAKLVYLELEGENTQFGQIETATLMANPRYSFKWWDEGTTLVRWCWF